MKKTLAIIVIAAICLWGLGFFFIFMPGSGGPPSYLAFTFHRSQKYYSRFADACDGLIATVGTNQYQMKRDDPRLPVWMRNSKLEDLMGFTNMYEITGDDARLPDELKRIKPAVIEVTTNSVWLYVNIRADYAIKWETDYANPKAMVLAVYSESPTQRVYFRTNNIPPSALRIH
jgi:hypothetical protein